MDNTEQLKQQLSDITSQITIEPKDLEIKQKHQQKGEDFSRKAKRFNFYQQAEEICTQRFPDTQVKKALFLLN